MTNDRRLPNHRLMMAVYPADTHLDNSRASSNGMRGSVRDDRSNLLVGQVELFDATDRYADGYNDGYDHRSHDEELLRHVMDFLAREVAHRVVDAAWDAAARGVAAARPHVNAWVRQRMDNLRRPPKTVATAPQEPIQEIGPEHAPSRSAAATAGCHRRVDPVLRAAHGDARANAAMERIIARAVEVHGLAAHYAADQPGAGAADEAMRQAVAAAAPALAAATLQLVSLDEALDLTPEQKMYIWERAADLDLAVVEDLTGTNAIPAHGVEDQ